MFRKEQRTFKREKSLKQKQGKRQGSEKLAHGQEVVTSGKRGGQYKDNTTGHLKVLLKGNTK